MPQLFFSKVASKVILKVTSKVILEVTSKVIQAVDQDKDTPIRV